MKYVIFKENLSGRIHPVILPESTNHSDVSVNNSLPISAGFFIINKGVLTCFGHSKSLNLKSLPEDKKYLVALLNNHGEYSFLSFNQHI